MTTLLQRIQQTLADTADGSFADQARAVLNEMRLPDENMLFRMNRVAPRLPLATVREIWKAGCDS
jgi:hypothetical protein